MYCDYFVYRADHRRPSLDLLPNPYPQTFGDNEIAVLSCDNGDGFVVAALRRVLSIKPTFKLHLYRSTDGSQGSWTCQLLSVEKPLRHKNLPVLPDSAPDVYHLSTKVIVLGGDKGIVGWVDLWRGIILCNVLSPNPQLLDVPLPSRVVADLDDYLYRCPSYSRDITVTQAKDTIKYVEMEITPPEEVSDPNPMLYNQGLPLYIIPGDWKTTTYKMPIGVGSVHKWEEANMVRLSDLDPPVGNQRVRNLINILLRTSESDENNKKLEVTKETLQCMSMAYPTLSTDDDDVVYFLTKGTRMGSMGSMRGLSTVDMKGKTLQGVALLDTKRHIAFMRPFVASGSAAIARLQVLEQYFDMLKNQKTLRR